MPGTWNVTTHTTAQTRRTRQEHTNTHWAKAGQTDSGRRRNGMTAERELGTRSNVLLPYSTYAVSWDEVRRFLDEILAR
jgi:hypothetical protein